MPRYLRNRPFNRPRSIYGVEFKSFLGFFFFAAWSSRVPPPPSTQTHSKPHTHTHKTENLWRISYSPIHSPLIISLHGSSLAVPRGTCASLQSDPSVTLRLVCERQGGFGTAWKVIFFIINLKITALIQTNQSHPLEKRQGVRVGGVGHLNYSLNNISSPALPLPRQPHRHLQGAYWRSGGNSLALAWMNGTAAGAARSPDSGTSCRHTRAERRIVSQQFKQPWRRASSSAAFNLPAPFRSTAISF